MTAQPARPAADLHAPAEQRPVATARCIAEDAASGDAAVLSGSIGEAWGAFVRRVPISFARRHRLMGTRDDEDRAAILVGVDDPAASAGTAAQREALDGVRRLLGEEVRVKPMPRETVLAAIHRGYEAAEGHAEQAIETINSADSVSRLLRGDADGASDSEEPTSGGKASGGGDLLEGEGRAPVVKLTNALLFEAVKLQASDVHLQPTEDRVAVRMRIDGVLFDAYELPRSTHEELVSRVKVMGRMNIAEKRLPQDGRASVRVGPRNIDLRLSTVPTSHGERVVFRLLDKSARLYGLDELGMPPEVLKQYSEVIRAEHGLVLVTGPTGSGKSTTLYGSLQRIDCKQLNVLTLEDPIEYQLPGVSQMQVSERKGMTFAKGLRSVLRQDPDIIMVGEIRDRETAELAIQAALTGHLVFSTLHTNDAPSAVTRLLDLGIEPYLVSSSLLAVMAQRLVRRVCGECVRTLDDEEAVPELLAMGLTLADIERVFAPRPRRNVGQEATNFSGGGDKPILRVGEGCPACRDTGYRGRLGLYEYLPMNHELRDAVQQRASASTLKNIARRRGMRSLWVDGVQKVLSGRTTPEEVHRVTVRLTKDEQDGMPASRPKVRGGRG